MNERDVSQMPDNGKESSSPSGFAKWRSDFQAGLINAVVSVPDGLASAALAGVNPVYGLYTSMTAAIAGSALVSTQLMQVATTSASALAAGQAIASYPEGQRDTALFTLVALTGVFLVIFGLLKLGRLVRFVSHAVMTGFLIGVAVVLILDQFAPLVGYSPEEGNEVTQFIDVLLHIDQWSGPTIIAGVLALAVMVGLARTTLSSISSLVALVAPALVVFFLGWGGVELVSDVRVIPRGLPELTLPDLTLLTPQLVLAAFSLAVVIAVQGAGVSQSYENPDGSPVSASRDMLAQGAANIAAGLVSGIPAGGSVGQTALNKSVGAQSRWGGIFGGLWMLAIIFLFPDLVGEVPMTVLAALMIVSGFGAIDFREALSIWSTGGSARWAIVVTFIATLVLSVPVAVATGVIFTIILFLASSASDIRIRRLELRDGHRIAELDPPQELESDVVTVLNVYGARGCAAGPRRSVQPGRGAADARPDAGRGDADRCAG
jgi:SulP family sulfate permease